MTIRVTNSKKGAPKRDRLEQLKKWLGKNYDGVIVLDECHNANNAAETKTGFGKTKASAQAKAVMDLVDEYPNARVLYVSATAATEVRHMSLMDRLGLWGTGRPFDTKAQFIDKISAGGLSAMETVVRSLKENGLYIARSLSMRRGPNGVPDEDVTYRTLTHNLSPYDTAQYNKIAEAWRVVMDNVEKAQELCKPKGSKLKNSSGASAFWSSNQNCLSQVITALKAQSLIDDMDEQLKQGKSLVIQLTNTNEAAAKRALERMSEDQDEEFDVTPKDILMRFVEHAFPVAQMIEVKKGEDEDAKVELVPLKDEFGNIVENPEAVALRDKLIRELDQVQFPSSPLDMIINHFGADNVAEITGRSTRVVARRPDGPIDVKHPETRTPTSRAADLEDFNAGRKHILIFSRAGNTGASYHAAKDIPNREKRVHYILQGGWSAKDAVQGIGRTHRTNQEHMPEYVLVTSSLAGEKRFTMTIARRLSQLGALTQGERGALTGGGDNENGETSGLFSESDNLESKEAIAALDKFYRQMTSGGDIVEGITSGKLLNLMGIKQNSNGYYPENIDMTRFLNRLLCLPVELQQDVFEAYNQVLTDVVNDAKEKGTLDTGLQDYRRETKALSVKVVEETPVFTDEESGAQVNYQKIESTHKRRIYSFNNAVSKGYDLFFLNENNGHIVALKNSGQTEWNNLTQKYDPVYWGYTPTGARNNGNTPRGRGWFPGELRFDKKWRELPPDEAEKIWTEQADELAKKPETRTVHLLSGSLLNVWMDLPQSNAKIKRVVTDNGKEYLGRIIPEEQIQSTLKDLGVAVETNSDLKDMTLAKLMERLGKRGRIAELTQGKQLKLSRVRNETRLELLNTEGTAEFILNGMGLIHEKIQSQSRWFVPIGNERAFQDVLKRWPLKQIRSMSNAESNTAALDELNSAGSWLDSKHPGFLRLGGSKPATPKHTAANSMDSDPYDTDPRDPNVLAEWKHAVKGRPTEDAAKIGRMKSQLRELVKGLTAAYPHITEPNMAYARKVFEELENQIPQQLDTVVDGLTKMVRSMDYPVYDVFRKYVILRDQMAFLEAEKTKLEKAKLKAKANPEPDDEFSGQEIPLSFGMNEEELRDWYERVQNAIQNEPDLAGIHEAVKTYDEFMEFVRRKLIEGLEAIGMNERARSPVLVRGVRRRRLSAHTRAETQS